MDFIDFIKVMRIKCKEQKSNIITADVNMNDVDMSRGDFLNTGNDEACLVLVAFGNFHCDSIKRICNTFFDDPGDGEDYEFSFTE